MFMDIAAICHRQLRNTVYSVYNGHVYSGHSDIAI